MSTRNRIRPRTSTRNSNRFPWNRLTDEQLLDMRICDLPIKIKGSFLEPHIKRLYSELNERGIRFKPHVWLAEEWFSPDRVPGIAIPFYLAHPRLMKLERNRCTGPAGQRHR